ncbi:sulfatase-like hydrolase/transferase [Algihabitans albus]|uniref:sulfatase-like hydrolase/transferase n=1 Tax=Algihabitans albus TaxID=2164067 RepID=UPI001ABD433E|nr:sulfatase-like hydrolase/transferase [Algihabitans albus]
MKIDGLHPASIDRFGLSNIQALRTRGTSVETAVLLFPAHPTVGDYGDWHSTSFPNVSTLAGTAFLREEPVFLQQVFRSRGRTLHAAGSAAYRSLNEGFDYALTASGVTDAEVMDFTMSALEAEGDIVFMRIMLQETGAAGRVRSGKNLSDEPWAQSIFHPESPYRAAAENADRQVGRLIAFLESRGQLHDTLFVVMGDGQSPHGWHLTLDEEAALTPLIFAGPGVAEGRVLDYAESIDVAPTITALMGLSPPTSDGGAGRVLSGVLALGEAGDHPRQLATINRQIRTYRQLHAQAVLAASTEPRMNLLLMELTHALLSEYQFFTPERIMEWHEAEDLDRMIEANDWVLETLRLALNESIYRFGEF